MNYQAKEVRETATVIRDHAENEWAEEIKASDMLTAYAADLDRRAEGVTDDVVKLACRRYYNSGQPVYPPEFEAMRAALLAVWPVAAKPAQLREAIRAMAQMLENHEWANLLSGDADIARLDAAISGAIRRTDAEPAQVDVIGTLEPLVRELETIDVPGVVLQQITLLGKFAVAARKLISEAMNARRTEPAQPADSGRVEKCCCGDPSAAGVRHRLDGPCYLGRNGVDYKPAHVTTLPDALRALEEYALAGVTLGTDDSARLHAIVGCISTAAPASPAGLPDDLYRNACESVESWKARALKAEETAGRLVEAMNDMTGPTFMGEPVLPKPAPDAKAMAYRFMGWRLPDDFRPDCGISFDPDSLKKWPGIWPTGTNILNVDQAEQMFRYVLAAAAPSPGEP